MTLVKTVALVGMMGVGKTAIGKRLAARLEVPFADADHEIEAAAGMEVKEIFAKYGEPEFRRLERSVIARLLCGVPFVLATGGGAFMDEGTRIKMGECAYSIWLRAPVDVLLSRIRKRQGNDHSRPLLAQGDMRATLERLLEARAPVYATADMVLDSADEPHGALLERVVAVLVANGLCEAP